MSNRKVVVTRTVTFTTVSDRSLWGNDSDADIIEVESDEGQFWDALFSAVETSNAPVIATTDVQFIEPEE